MLLTEAVPWSSARELVDWTCHAGVCSWGDRLCHAPASRGAHSSVPSSRFLRAGGNYPGDGESSGGNGAGESSCGKEAGDSSCGNGAGESSCGEGAGDWSAGNGVEQVGGESSGGGKSGRASPAAAPGVEQAGGKLVRGGSGQGGWRMGWCGYTVAEATGGPICVSCSGEGFHLSRRQATLPDFSPAGTEAGVEASRLLRLQGFSARR